MTRKLYYLANRISRNAERIREASLPHHLTVPRRRLLRHLAELNRLRDRWAAVHVRTRRPRRVKPLFLCPCDDHSPWRWPNRRRL